MDESSIVVVRVYGNGTLVCTKWCNSEQDAASIVADWCELPGVTCQIDNLSAATSGPWTQSCLGRPGHQLIFCPAPRTDARFRPLRSVSRARLGECG